MYDIVPDMIYYAGRIWSDKPFDGYLGIEDGIVREIGTGPPPEPASYTGHISAAVVDGHTHIGDAGLELDRRYTLEELVAPPDGLKHRYLSSAPRERIVSDMRDYSSILCGPVTEFIDFREGGIEGVRMIREATDRAVVLGRPVSRTFDANEVSEILAEADGIGIPSVSDLPISYIDAVADMTHRSGRSFAIHVSERVREDIDTVLSLEPDFVVHMCEATDKDMRACADAGVPVVVCATSNLYFGKVPPIARMVDSGLEMAIGTDNAMLCPPDILAEARVFASVASGQGCPPSITERALFLGGSKCLITRKIIGLHEGEAVKPAVVGFDDLGLRTCSP